MMDTSLNIVRALKQLSRGHTEVTRSPHWPQPEVSLSMRETVAQWLLAVCEEEAAEPELLCLAVQCLDAALARIIIKGAQLQLLAASCLLVSWKVRECRPISAVKIVKYTNYSVQLETLLEWEVYVLAKLNWNVPGLVATDFVDHILKNVAKVRTDLTLDSEARSRILGLIFQSHLSWRLASLAPSVLAAASVIVGLQPLLEVTPPSSSVLHTPSSSLSSNTSSPEMSARTETSSSKKSPFRVSESPIARVAGADNSVSVSSPELEITRSSDMERLIRSVQRITFVDKVVLQKAREELQSLAKTPKLPPSPEPSYSGASVSGERFSTSSPLPIAARSLFKDLEVKTPTKILEASTSITGSC